MRGHFPPPAPHAATGPTLRTASPTSLLLGQGAVPHSCCSTGGQEGCREEPPLLALMLVGHDAVWMTSHVSMAPWGEATRAAPSAAPCSFLGLGGLGAVHHGTPRASSGGEPRGEAAGRCWFCSEQAVPPPINWALTPRGEQLGVHQSLPSQPPRSIQLCSHCCPQPPPGCAIALGSQETQR